MRKYKVLYEIIYGRPLVNRFIKRKPINNMGAKIRQLISEHHYEKAIKEIEDNRQTAIFEYAYCLQCLGKAEEANQAMRKYLKANTINLDCILEHIYISQYQNRKDDVSLTYKYLGGFANYGFILHYSSGKILSITKIADANKSANEAIFYEKYVNHIPNANQFIPVCSAVEHYNDKITLITTEYMEFETLSNADDDKVMEVIRFLESYSALEFLNNSRGNDKLLYSGNSEVCHLNSSLSFRMMNEKMQALLKSKKANDIIAKRIYTITNDILRMGVQKRITLDYYSFCHNDFHRKNVFLNKGRIVVLDWNNYRYGIKGWDVAYYWGNFERSFNYIRDNYIEKYCHTRLSIKDEICWRICFSFCLLYVWVDRLHGNEVTNFLNEYFLPICDYIQTNLQGLEEK